jgi:enoyl-CoA hydratase/carnithine racemase
MTSASTRVYVDFRETGPIARIALNRPEKLNAINVEVGLQLYEAFARCESDTAIRAIVLAGAGRAFCSGDELGRERTPDEEISFRRRGFIKHYVEGPGRWTRTLQLMRRLPQPIVCRIQGYAYGAGFNLALGSDFRIMANDARLATPFIKRALATGTNLEDYAEACGPSRRSGPEIHGPLGEAGHWPQRPSLPSSASARRGTRPPRSVG